MWCVVLKRLSRRTSRSDGYVCVFVRRSCRWGNKYLSYDVRGDRRRPATTVENAEYWPPFFLSCFLSKVFVRSKNTIVYKRERRPKGETAAAFSSCTVDFTILLIVVYGQESSSQKSGCQKKKLSLDGGHLFILFSTCKNLHLFARPLPCLFKKNSKKYVRNQGLPLRGPGRQGTSLQARHGILDFGLVYSFLIFADFPFYFYQCATLYTPAWSASPIHAKTWSGAGGILAPDHAVPVLWGTRATSVRAIWIFYTCTA